MAIIPAFHSKRSKLVIRDVRRNPLTRKFESRPVHFLKQKSLNSNFFFFLKMAEFKLESNEEASQKERKDFRYNLKKLEKRKDNSGLLDKEIGIKFRLGNVIKGAGLILVLLAVFFLGRWSMEGPASLTDNQIETKEEAGKFSITGFFSGLAEIFKSEETAGLTNEEKKSGETAEISSQETKAEEQKQTTGETEEKEETAAETDEGEEKLAESYKKVTFTVKDLKLEWKTTWGKINWIDYSIRNDEDGTIKPDYIIMIVEGYGDFEKKVPLPLSSKSIEAKTIISTSAMVPSGFAYSEKTAGDLKGVLITFSLYDAKDKLIAGEIKKEFNLDKSSSS